MQSRLWSTFFWGAGTRDRQETLTRPKGFQASGQTGDVLLVRTSAGVCAWPTVRTRQVSRTGRNRNAETEILEIPFLAPKTLLSSRQDPVVEVERRAPAACLGCSFTSVQGWGGPWASGVLGTRSAPGPPPRPQMVH